MNKPQAQGLENPQNNIIRILTENNWIFPTFECELIEKSIQIQTPKHKQVLFQGENIYYTSEYRIHGLLPSSNFTLDSAEQTPFQLYTSEAIITQVAGIGFH